MQTLIKNKESFGKLEYLNILLRSLVFQILTYSFLTFSLVMCYPLTFFSRKILLKFFRSMTKWLVLMLKIILRIDFVFKNTEILRKAVLEQESFIIASKHQSGVETVIFSLFFDDFNIVFKKSLGKVPLIGRYMRRMEFLGIDRANGKESLVSLIEKGKKSMEDKRPLVIFPEGARIKFGNRGTYHKGVAILYEKLNVPILPVAHNAGAIWHKKSFVKFPGTITFEFLPLIKTGMTKEEVIKKIEANIEDACLKLRESA